MLVSYSKNFIYFKPMKVSGTSVQVALVNNCSGKSDIVTPIAHTENEVPRYKAKNYEESFISSHDTPSSIRVKIDQGFIKRATKITVIRNPWAVLVSKYKALCKDEQFRSLHPTLNDYVDRYHLYTNSRFYFSKQGEKYCDVYLRQENIEEDLKELCLNHNLELAEIPKLKVSPDRRHYSTFIDDNLAKEVARVCKKQIDIFGYSFSREEEYSRTPWEL